MPKHDKISGGHRSRNDQPGMTSLPLESMMREVLHTIGDLDFQHAAAMEKLEASTPDENIKRHIKTRLLARHRERREPYVELLADFRKRQYRQALAA